MKIYTQFICLLIFFYIIDAQAQQPGWVQISSGTSADLFSIHVTKDSVAYATGSGGTILKSTDGGLTWSTLNSNVVSNLFDVFALDQLNVIAVGDGSTIIRTTDGGNSWNLVASGVTETLYSVSFSGTYGICGGELLTILYSTNSGESWHISQTGSLNAFYSTSMLSPQIGFVAGELLDVPFNKPFFGKTTDSGMNWEFTAFFLNNNEGTAHGIDFTDEQTGYICSAVWNGQGAISKTTNGGANWTTTLFDHFLWSIDFPISGASQIGYSVGDQGIIFKTSDAGLTWQPQQSGTSQRLNKIYFIDLDFGFAVGENGLILRTTSGGEPVEGIYDEITEVNSFKLSQNYPNPFNPSTTIQYSIPESGNVKLEVYNSLGEEVSVLVDEYKEAGNYKINFNAGELSSGIYFYKLTTNNYSSIKKMILLK
ncbi:MAG: YCF48-related protein [Ignavibacteriaceae bacterium]|nr:YCF48-related protein [Ignavibacteriaceae bacterium]MCW8812106.1 YCF48-related protein [Chlorobium sp.]MCW8824537.1 YCF48-related protein [Ignavibacteriaceae bacterium]